MKTVHYSEYGAADVLEVVDVAAPDVTSGVVKIDVRAVSVNPVDCKIRAGMMRKFMALDFPVGIGRDGSGVVCEVGPGVSGINRGDEVSFLMPRGASSTAEQIVVAAELTAPKPTHLSFAEAAAYPLVAVTAWLALSDKYTGDIAGRDVLIHGGAGGVGGMAVQIACAKGANVVATASAENVAYVKSLGATSVIAYDEQDFSQELRDIDVVFDTMGGEVHRRSYDVLKKGGRMVCVNAAPIEDLSGQYGVTMQVADVTDVAGALKETAALVAGKELVPEIKQIFPLAEIAAAHRAVETGRARGKVVVCF